MKELGIKKSFIISLSGHLILLIFLAFIMAARIQNEDKDLVTVNLEPLGESLSKDLGDNMYEPSRKSLPRLGERKTLTPENKTIPEKAMPEKEKESEKSIPGATGEDLTRNSHDNKTDTAEFKNQVSNTISQEEMKQQEINKLFGDIEKALEQGGSASSIGGNGSDLSGDPLSDASWGSRPRKTTFFPDIQSKIPDQYKRKGLNYSITVRLTFDKNGLASMVEIITSSGDPAIDSIFNEELRKIRVEPIDVDRIDKVTKIFKISLK
jgi:outer membrane biosynthesis protein TonB